MAIVFIFVFWQFRNIERIDASQIKIGIIATEFDNNGDKAYGIICIRCNVISSQKP
jgi:hypothetical protein